MKVSINTIHIPYNFVLVKPDLEFNKFHNSEGQESLATGAVDMEHAASHYSVRGQVFGLPEALIFNLDAIKNNKIPQTTLSFDEIMFYFRSQFKQAQDYKDASMLYKTKMQLNALDIVYFNYQEHYNCYEQGRWVDTKEHGEMLLMRYDQLILCHRNDGLKNNVMLNGYVLVNPITTESVYGQNIYKRAGIFVADMKPADMAFKKDLNIGYVRYAGNHCEGFLEKADETEGSHDFIEGDLVLYNPKVAPPLEFQLHETHFAGMQLVKLRRRDIFCILPSEIIIEALHAVK